MVKYILIFILFFLLQLSTIGQDTTIKYLDKNMAITPNIENAAFVANITKAEDGWYAKIYYGRENIALEGYYKDKKLTIKHGLFRFYYASTSRIMSIGSFTYNIPNGLWQKWYENGKQQDSGKKYFDKEVGAWKYWHRNGQLKAQGKYADSILIPGTLANGIIKESKAVAIADYIYAYYNNIQMGLWKTYYENGQIKDSINYEEGLKTGIVKSWYSNGNMESVGAYTHNREENTWNWFHENGNPSTVEVYKKGIVQQLQCFDTNGKLVGSFCSLNKPALFKGGLGNFETYMAKKITYPDAAKKNKHQAIVETKFTINTMGKVQDIVITNSPTIYFNQEIERVLYAMPDWEPSVSHNRLVDYRFSLRVPFVYKEE
jgi:antitoxin component YwqK of YwqJK toxin-antitoxin module